MVGDPGKSIITLFANRAEIAKFAKISCTRKIAVLQYFNTIQSKCKYSWQKSVWNTVFANPDLDLRPPLIQPRSRDHLSWIPYSTCSELYLNEIKFCLKKTHFLSKGRSFFSKHCWICQRKSDALNIKVCILCQDDIYFHLESSGELWIKLLVKMSISIH